MEGEAFKEEWVGPQRLDAVPFEGVKRGADNLGGIWMELKGASSYSDVRKMAKNWTYLSMYYHHYFHH